MKQNRDMWKKTILPVFQHYGAIAVPIHVTSNERQETSWEKVREPHNCSIANGPAFHLWSPKRKGQSWWG
jgi:hypothetical protein